MEEKLEQGCQGLWRLLKKNQKGQVEKVELEDFWSHVAKAMLPECSNEDARRLGTEAVAVNSIADFKLFVNSVMDISQAFCRTERPEESLAFLVSLKLRITQLTVHITGDQCAHLVPGAERRLVASEEDAWKAQSQCLSGNFYTPPPHTEPSQEDGEIWKSIALAQPDQDVELSNIRYRIVHESLCGLDAVASFQEVDTGGKTAGLPSLREAILARFAGNFSTGEKGKACELEFRAALDKSRTPSSGRAQEESMLSDRVVATSAAAGLAKEPKLWIIGGPATGKSSVSARLSSKLGTALIDGQSADAEEAVSKAAASGKGFVVDGGHENDSLVSMLLDSPALGFLHVIVLGMDEQDLVHRKLSLRVHKPTGQVYIGSEWKHKLQEELDREAKRQAQKEADAEAAAAEEEGKDSEGENEQGEGEQGAEQGGPLPFREEDLEAVYDQDAATKLVQSSVTSLHSVETRVAQSPHSISHVRAQQPLEALSAQAFAQVADGDLNSFSLLRPGFMPALTQAKCLDPLLDLSEPTPINDTEGQDPETEPQDEEQEVPQPDFSLPVGAEEIEARSQILFNVQVKVAVARKQEHSQDGEEEEEQEESFETGPTMYSFRKLSDWGFICPVTQEEGSSQFAVLHNGKVYFCSTKNAARSFIQAPAKYLSHQVRFPGRVVVLGDTQIAQAIATNHTWRLVHAPEDTEQIEAFVSGAGLADTNDWVVCVSNQATDHLEALVGHLRDLRSSPRKLVYTISASSLADHQEQAEDGEAPSEEQSESKTEADPWAAVAEFAEANQIFFTTAQSPEQATSLLNPLKDLMPKVEQVFLGSIEDDATIVDQALGWSGKFCPVSLVDRQRYIAGKRDIVAFYDGAFFKFASLSDKENFERDPQRYVTSILVEQAPTVFVFGPQGSGQSTTATEIHNKLGLEIVTEAQFDAFVQEKRFKEKEAAKAAKAAAKQEALKAKADQERESNSIDSEEHDSSESKEDVAEGDQEEQTAEPGLEEEEEEEEEEGEEQQDQPGTDDEWIAFIEGKLSETRASGTVFDAVGLTADRVARLLEKKCHPTLVINLQASEEVCVARNMANKFSWEPPRRPESANGDVVEEDKEEAQEVAPPTKEELEEMKEQAREEKLVDFQEQYASFCSARDEVIEAFREGGVDIQTVDMNGRTGLKHALRMLVAHVKSRWPGRSNEVNAHRVAPVTPSVCEAMFDAGLIESAPFGPYCPVTLAQAGVLEKGSELVVFNGKAFALHKAHLKAFFSCPSAFVDLQAVGYETLPLRMRRVCAIAGPPKSGKTTLADNLSKAHQLLRINALECALEASKEVDPYSLLPSHLASVLMSQESPIEKLDVELVVQCIKAASAGSDAQQGYVLDGFPRTVEECQVLASHELLPPTMVVLSPLASMADVKARIRASGADAAQVLGSQEPCTLCELECFLASDKRMQARLLLLNSNSSPWFNQQQLEQDILVKTRVTEKVVCESNIDVWSQSSCSGAVRLNMRELIGSSRRPDATDSSKYCLVSFTREGKLLATCGACRVAYKGKVYGFVNQVSMLAFYENPQAFENAQDSFEDAIASLPLSAEELLSSGDRTGYLQQTVVPVMIQALERLGADRLKHPCLPVRGTALKYVSLYLRANNPSVSEPCREARQRVLDMFVEECRLFHKISETAVRGTGLAAVRRQRQVQDKERKEEEKDEDDKLTHKPQGLGEKEEAELGSNQLNAAKSEEQTETDEGVVEEDRKQAEEEEEEEGKEDEEERVGEEDSPEELVERFHKLLRQNSAVLAARLDVKQ